VLHLLGRSCLFTVGGATWARTTTPGWRECYEGSPLLPQEGSAGLEVYEVAPPPTIVIEKSESPARRGGVQKARSACRVAQSRCVTASGERLRDFLVSVGRFLHPFRPYPLRQTDSSRVPSHLPNVVEAVFARAYSVETFAILVSLN